MKMCHQYARRPRSCMRIINLTCGYLILNLKCKGPGGPVRAGNILPVAGEAGRAKAGREKGACHAACFWKTPKLYLAGNYIPATVIHPSLHANVCDPALTGKYGPKPL